MKRLTIRSEKGAALKMADAYDSETAARQDLMKRYLVAIERLAAYEDTGMEPEEIIEILEVLYSYRCICAGLDLDRLRALAQAEKDGRLVVLPPNDPLTLEEMQEMGGEPYWHVGLQKDSPQYCPCCGEKLKEEDNGKQS